MITLTRGGPVLTVTLDRPERMNAIDPAMAARLAALGDELRGERDAAVILLRGAGPAFMAGGDIASFHGTPDETVPRVASMMTDFHHFVQALTELRQPVVGAIHGSAAGGGLSVALACDVLVAAEGTRLKPAYGLLGTSPDGGLTAQLARLLGPKRAFRMLVVDDDLPLAEAAALGLVTRIVPPADLDRTADEIARHLAEKAGPASAETKALLRDAAATPLAAQMEAEMAAFLRCMVTAEFAEGVAAFAEKRRPVFPRASRAITS